MKTTDECLYFAKATLPALPWKSEWTTQAKAFAKAQWFVRQWREVGTPTEACVFYRGGSIVAVVNFTNCDQREREPDADLNAIEHDDRGDS